MCGRSHAVGSVWRARCIWNVFFFLACFYLVRKYDKEGVSAPINMFLRRKIKYFTHPESSHGKICWGLRRWRKIEQREHFSRPFLGSGPVCRSCRWSTGQEGRNGLTNTSQRQDRHSQSQHSTYTDQRRALKVDEGQSTGCPIAWNEMLNYGVLSA